MEIDTGASLSLVSEQIYQELWPSVPLQSTSVNLKTYSGTPLKVLGLMNVEATNNDIAFIGCSWNRSQSIGS